MSLPERSELILAAAEADTPSLQHSASQAQPQGLVQGPAGFAGLKSGVQHGGRGLGNAEDSPVRFKLPPAARGVLDRATSRRVLSWLASIGGEQEERGLLPCNGLPNTVPEHSATALWSIPAGSALPSPSATGGSGRAACPPDPASHNGAGRQGHSAGGADAEDTHSVHSSSSGSGGSSATISARWTPVAAALSHPPSTRSTSRQEADIESLLSFSTSASSRPAFGAAAAAKPRLQPRPGRGGSSSSYTPRRTDSDAVPVRSCASMHFSGGSLSPSGSIASSLCSGTSNGRPQWNGSTHVEYHYQPGLGAGSPTAQRSRRTSFCSSAGSVRSSREGAAQAAGKGGRLCRQDLSIPSSCCSPTRSPSLAGGSSCGSEAPSPLLSRSSSRIPSPALGYLQRSDSSCSRLKQLAQRALQSESPRHGGRSPGSSGRPGGGGSDDGGGGGGGSSSSRRELQFGAAAHQRSSSLSSLGGAGPRVPSPLGQLPRGTNGSISVPRSEGEAPQSPRHADGPTPPPETSLERLDAQLAILDRLTAELADAQELIQGLCNIASTGGGGSSS